MLWLGLLIFIVLGAIDIWQLFHNKEQFTRQCENETNLKTNEFQGFFGVSLEGQRDEACRKLADVSAVVVAILFGILVLVLMWLIGIVTKYKHQLQQSNSGYYRQSHIFGNVGRSGGNEYAPAQTREVDEAGLLQTTAPPAGWKDASYEQISTGHHAKV